jgi:nucleotide-binding universal stress UspA family protein
LLALSADAREPGDEASFGAAIQGARSAAYLDDVLARLLPSHPAAPFVAASSAMPADAGSYVFLSYAHADRAFAHQVVERLARAGVKVWYDTGIEPGTAWDDELEQRIRGACGLVACVSSSFEQSRWCTRELKFADFLRKPIVPVAAEPWTWGEGLQLMFQSLQVASFDHGRGAPALLATLRRHAAAAFAGEPCAERSG